jgi:arylsulfatase A-like enzyme
VGLAARPPDLVVLVLDCVRATDFPGGRDPVPGMRFFESIRKESVVFPKAVSVSPWTVPSHASLFTGLYPWEHGAHAKGSLRLKSTIPRLPALLHAEGYETLCLSGNPLLNPAFDLDGGFDAAARSEWWEPIVRNHPGVGRAKSLDPVSATKVSRSQRLHDSPMLSLLHGTADLVYRYPFLVDGANRVMHRMGFTANGSHAAAAQWIEPTFRGWLARRPRSESLFAFVNFVDAHEPYFGDEEVLRGFREWWRYARTWQDRPGHLAGRWTPTAEELAMLRNLYRAQIRALDHRVENLVEALRAAGRWENTMLVVTSDHGQAFGEGGSLFHMHRVDEALVRVPLWVRYPNGEHGGTVAKGWASLIDVVPTLLKEAGDGHRLFPSAATLDGLLDAPRPGAVFAMADGLPLEQERSGVTREREKLWDRVFVAAYAGDRKLVLDATANAPRAFDLASDPDERVDIWPSRRVELAALLGEAQRIAGELTRATPEVLSPEIEDRLRSWGYL